MYVYHLYRCHNIELGCMPFDVMRRRIINTAPKLLVGYSPDALQHDKDEFFRLIPMIGWNGTAGGDLQCFYVPHPHAFHVSLLLTNGTDASAFIGTPYPLAYLHDSETIDRTDTNEKARTIAAMTGETWSQDQPVVHSGWRMSQRGNLWTTIDGTNCVILQDGPGYKGLLRGGGANTITTRVFKTRDEVSRYIETNYKTLIKQWIIGARMNVATNPFFEDDED